MFHSAFLIFEKNLCKTSAGNENKLIQLQTIKLLIFSHYFPINGILIPKYIDCVDYNKLIINSLVSAVHILWYVYQFLTCP